MKPITSDAGVPGLPRLPAPQFDHHDQFPSKLIVSLLGVLLVFWLWPPLASLHQHSGLFPVSVHTITEFAAIVAALLVFSVAWHARSAGQPGNIVVIGCGFLAVGLIDFGHVLSYKGMPDFVTPSGPQKAIQFWLLARYTATLTLLVAAWQPVRPISSAWWRAVLLSLSLSFVLLVYVVQLWLPQVWPSLFIEGQGLTPFKVAAEYGVIVLTSWLPGAFTGRQTVRRCTAPPTCARPRSSPSCPSCA
jgi:hypothetical protein